MNEPAAQKPNAWVRALPLWHSLFFISLLTVTVILLIDPDTVEQRLTALLLSGLLGIWYAASVWWLTTRNRTQMPYLLAYFIIGWVIWFALTNISLVYMLLLFGLFPHVFMSMRLLWASIGAAILMALVVLRQTTVSSDGVSTLIVLMSLATIGGIVIARFIEAIINESIARQQLITTLESTRRELAAAERQAGILQERQRLAGEIHDTLAQGLTSIVMHLEAAEAALNETPIVQQHLNEARTIARANLSEARRVVWGLRPQALEQQAVESALLQAVNDWSASNRIAAEMVVIGTRVTLSLDKEVALLRVLQEALANVAKHACAQHVTVTLSYMPNAVVVDIHDDGVGFTDTQKPVNGHSGFGLLNMRERLTQLQGTLTIASSADEGTTLVAEIPLP